MIPERRQTQKSMHCIILYNSTYVSSTTGEANCGDRGGSVVAFRVGHGESRREPSGAVEILYILFRVGITLGYTVVEKIIKLRSVHFIVCKCYLVKNKTELCHKFEVLPPGGTDA